MVLKRLRLQGFRSYLKKEFEFASKTVLVVGPNTSGKTNLLEGIYLLATGKSFRAGLEKEMINSRKEIARVKGRIKSQGEIKDLEIVLTPGQLKGERVAKKKYLANGVSKRRVDFLGHFRSVLFRPEDLELIINSPSKRRDYLDEVLEVVDSEYRRANLSYQKGLRQRNKLLTQIQKEGKARSVLFFWDKLLLENGELIAQKREDFINFVNQQPEYFGDLNLVYDQNVISPQRLEKYARQEVAAGMTLVGPHRDDLTFRLKKRNLHAFGSRGEQRMAVFNLKLAELVFVSQKTQTRPVLLLDDIFSELDKTHREQIMKVIPQQQTIITATGLGPLEKKHLQKTQKIELG